MKTYNNWSRLFFFFIVWIVCSIVFYLPLIIFYPDLFIGTKREYSTHIGDNLILQIVNQIVSVCGVFAAIYFIIKVIEAKDFSQNKLTIKIVDLLKGFFIGFVFFITVALVMQFTGVVHFTFIGITSKITLNLLLFLLVATGEEVVVRGYILNNLCEKMNSSLAVLISSLAFGCLHLFNDHFTLIGFFNIILSGILMGILLVKSDTISAPIGLHWAWNFIQGPVAGFNVSGHEVTGVFHVETLAPTFLTGGEFGAEGSILLIPIVLIAIYIVWKYYRPVPLQVIIQRLSNY